MKYVVFSYNMLTLCRSLRYIDEVWGKENSTIIYADLVSPIPKAIEKDYDVRRIDTDLVEATKRGFSLIFGCCKSAKKAWKILDGIISDTDDEVTLVVFRDNQPQEATIIENMRKKYPDRTHVFLAEEGTAIYALSTTKTRFVPIKKLAYKLYGVSLYSLKDKPQTENKYVEKVICLKPDLAKEKIKSDNIQVEKMIDIFTTDFNDYIIKAVLGESKASEKYDYVFLTQPFTDFRGDYKRLMKTCDELMPKIFEILSKKGNTVIKPHPREGMDYSVFTKQNVKLVSANENKIPFECLMQYYGNPQLISMCSSVSVSLQTEKPSIYLFSLFDLPGIEESFSDDFKEKNNIIVCRTLEDFENALVCADK